MRLVRLFLHCSFVDAVDVPVTQVDGKLPGHERGVNRLSVRGVGPEVREQQTGAVGDRVPDAAKQITVAVR
jgi:hypothetical protein